MMFRKLSICIILHCVFHSTSSWEDAELQVQIELTISKTRKSVHEELDKLKVLVAFLSLKAEKKALDFHSFVAKNKVEALFHKSPVAYCVTFLDQMSSNLDLYDLEQCRLVPCYVHEALSKAQNLIVWQFKLRAPCTVWEQSSLKKMHQCLVQADLEVNNKRKRTLRTLEMLSKRIFTDGLLCAQKNFNNFVNTLCLLGCHFQECVKAKKNKMKTNEKLMQHGKPSGISREKNAKLKP